MTVLCVVVGAALGAPLRFLVAHWLDGRTPWGTAAVNVVGSGLLGLFAALSLDDRGWALLGVGFCGGLTTFSAFAVQAVGLGPRRGSAYVVGTVVLSLAACAVGFAAGS
ncbi:fluoride efflux transporter FluC [Nocardioides caldifontis]|uniref:fluoride efflux transporter FluC n=1 Tax=Nocardioides caldifontis TaxID=2588938 RepID=UPI0011DFD7E9|nr:CrcB family protein [Nocardioides caldifontis]